MKLLTFLGTGNYQKTQYTWRYKQVETAYVAEALSNFFEPDEVRVFVTQEAKEKHWKELESRLIQLANPAPVDIPSGQSENEIWEIFEEVVESVSSNETIIFDITHAFRSLPILVLLASAFLQKARDVQIQGVYYGAFEIDKKQPPIIDITSAVTLLDWLTATKQFLSTGSSLELGKLLSGIQQDFYSQGKHKIAKNKPKTLKKFGDRIQSISTCLDLVRPMGLMEETYKLKQIPTETIENEVGIFAKPFKLLLNQIQQDYGQFALNNSNENDPKTFLQQKFLLLRWYVAKDMNTQAILLAREWIVTALCIVEQVPSFINRNSRKKIEDQLNAFSGENRDFDQPITKHIDNVEQLTTTWSKLSDYRNDLAHAEMRSTSFSANILQQYVQKDLIAELTSLFPDYTL